MMKADELRTNLQARLAVTSKEEVLRRLGLSETDPESLRQLDEILQEPFLGLDRGYAGVQFLRSLCEALGLQAAEEIEAIRDDLHKLNYDMRPHLLADTGFKRADRPGMSIMALAGLPAKSRIELSQHSKIASWEELVREASDLVRQHYANSGGELKPWGTIKRYLLHVEGGKTIEFDLDGRVVNERDADANEDKGKE